MQDENDGAAPGGQPAQHAGLGEALIARLSGNPRLFSVLALYAVWLQLTRRVPERAGPWGPRWLAWLISRLQSGLLDFANAGRLEGVVPPPAGSGFDPDGQYLVTWHPHGAFTTMAFMHCGHHTVIGQPLTWYPAIASVLFRVPVFREIAMLLNARAVTGSVLERLLSAGLSVGVQPGGIPEQMQADHRRETAVFPPNLGFIRLAMRHGVPLLPGYIFGENQAYKTTAAGRALAAATYRWFRFPIVLVLGHLNLPWLYPRKVPISVCWGRPVPVGPPNASPSDDEVRAVFARYCDELKRLFDEHKEHRLPPDVAEKGLEIVHRKSRL